MNELLNFWNFVNKTFDSEEIEWYIEQNELDSDMFSVEHLSSLAPEEIDDIFSDVINLYMDVSGVDSIHDVFELLKSYIKDEARINKLLS